MRHVLSFCAALVLGFVSMHTQAQTTLDSSYITGGSCPGGSHTGVPIVLCGSGQSYKLVGNLSPSGVDGIDITADNITLDLNGYVIKGNLGSCNANGHGNTCSSTGTLSGISVTGRNVTIKNGMVYSISGNGINFPYLSTGGSLTLTDIIVSQNRGNGVNALRPVSMRNVEASLNTGGGIVASAQPATLVHVIANYNNGTGVSVTGGVLEDITASYNNSNGIALGGGSLTRAQGTTNNGVGISIEAATLRDGYVNGNTSDGISAVGSIIFHSTSFNNGGSGFSLDSLSCYQDIGGNVSGGSVLSSSTGLCAF